MADTPRHTMTDVPQEVFEAVLEELAKAGIAADTLERLRTCLIVEGQLSDRALRGAIFPEDLPR